MTKYKKLIAMGLAPAVALAGAYLIIPHEGREDYYLDPVGIATICYGHTGKYVEQRSYTDDECLEILSIDLRETEKYVDSVIKVPFISGYEEAAYISFTYNLGVGNLRVSTMASLINSENHEAACDQLVRWVYAGGQVFSGLVTRRGIEKQYCLGQITVKEYEESIRQIEIEDNQELEEGVSDLQCLVPPDKFDYSCKCSGFFCPTNSVEYVINNSYISYGRYFLDTWCCGKDGETVN